MNRLHSILFFCLSLMAGTVWAQSGELQGRIFSETGEPLSFAVVQLLKDGSMVNNTVTDFDGNYNFANVATGTYDLSVSYVSYPIKTTIGISISSGRVTSYDL